MEQLETSAPASTLTPHATSVVVWDVPSAVVPGERFRIRVGVKCADECRLVNHEFGIYDDRATQVAGGALSGQLWPGTTGLYVADVELEAPAGEGLFAWSVRIPSTPPGAGLPGAEPGAGIPHAESSAGFGVRVVSQPECLVTIEAVDEATQTPLSGARVVMHPYRAVTDERGVAMMRVAKGTYRLFVSQTRYVTFGLPVDVAADMTTRAELSVEPVPERN
ncbi:MAG: hypothetical protein HY824_06310 [Acidobacteria bacterium]|nr:hypothetical protein [Acidobacteriota bacterium]